MVTVRRFYEEVGRRLRQARLRAELTQQELADVVELSRASIANIEGGRQPFAVHTLALCARALDVPVSELIPGAEWIDSETELPAEVVEGLDEQSQNWVRKVLASSEQPAQ